MQWDDLRFVLALERARTLSAAARELGVAHTTVSRRLRGLEKSLGVALFERAGDQFEATAAGRDLCRVAARVEEEIFGAERRVMGRDRKLVGKLRVTTFDVVSVGMFPLFAAFRRHYPAVELTLTTDDRALSLHRREADVALRLSREPPPSLVGRRVGKIHFAVYGARALVEAVGANAPWEAFPWLHWDERLDNRWIDDWLAAHAPGAPIAMRLDGNFGVLLRAVRLGVGVHFLPCFVADEDPDLLRIGGVLDEFAQPLWVLTLEELRRRRRVRAFTDFVADHCRAEAARLEGRRPSDDR
ncbi:MAG: LysR family transcriptional regulator [Polyangiaceae bacterium]